jgi:2-dehydro-3-deoxygluconokinase
MRRNAYLHSGERTHRIAIAAEKEPDMKTYVTFGEIMLRLSPPKGERLLQSPVLSARFGGGEANVAVSLARFGHAVRYLTVLPEGPLGDAAIGELKRWGISTDFILRGSGRLGLYFAETGANQRPSQVLYDREYSALALSGPGTIDWDLALEGAGWLHVTGITPAVSSRAADLTLEAVQRAKSLGLTVSLDLNYRAKLWKYGKSAPEVMGGIMQYADVAVANEEDCQKSLGIEAASVSRHETIDIGVYEDLTSRVMDRFPNLGRLAVTLRTSHSADHNGWGAVMRTVNGFIKGPEYDIRNIVDRIGGGDAFAAGLIHGLQTFDDDGEALSFAVAASCLKHSICGDFNLSEEKDVLRLMQGDASGRVRR